MCPSTPADFRTERGTGARVRPRHFDLRSLHEESRRAHSHNNMNKPIAFAALVAFVAVSCFSSVSGQQQDKTVLTVDVYYESLCADSIRFITQELAPAYKDLKDVLKVNLVPFGKASWVAGNPPEFTCQHGPNECRGNREQACALYEIEKTLKPEDRQLKQVEVVNCAMSNPSPASAVPQCAGKIGLSGESIERIKSCSRTNLGNELLIAYGEKTKAFQSPLAFVPAIVINGELKSEAFRNFTATICQLVPAGQKPSVCGPQ